MRASLAAVVALACVPATARESAIAHAAERHGIPVSLVEAVVAVESGGDARAVSPKGAMGLMQLMPETAARFGVTDPLDAGQSLDGGCAYLRWLLDRFDGNLALVLAAYNAGEGAVTRYDGVPPFEETREYVRAVLVRLGKTAAPRQAAPGSSIVSLAQAGASSSIVCGGSR